MTEGALLAKEVMAPLSRTVAPDARVDERWFLDDQSLIVVCTADTLVGVITPGLWGRTVAERGPEVPAGEMASPDFSVAGPDEPLAAVLDRLSRPCLVLRGRTPVGHLTPGLIMPYICRELQKARKYGIKLS